MKTITSKTQWSHVFARGTLLFSIALLVGAVLGPVSVAHAATVFTVNSTGDASDANMGDGLCETVTPGECTLRAAIEEAGFPGIDTIAFNIPGAGPHTITPSSVLPFIIDAVIIDGY